jgi:phosphoglycolate phosphatase-like HAD superfamily hydrolase
MPGQTPRVVLFDIDGTLVNCHGTGTRSLESGFRKAFPEFSDVPFPALELGGATDFGVARFILSHYGLEHHPVHRDNFLRAYENDLDRLLGEGTDPPRVSVLPGVRELLAKFESLSNCATGLLTGNSQIGAAIKLRHAGLSGGLDWGAFGDDHEDRNALGHIAIERAAARLGSAIHPEQVIIIGDTIRDIACARACGAKVIAVATGHSTWEQLAEAGPDLLVADLTNLPAIFEVLG